MACVFFGFYCLPILSKIAQQWPVYFLSFYSPLFSNNRSTMAVCIFEVSTVLYSPKNLLNNGVFLLKFYCPFLLTIAQQWPVYF
jgi:hypothetical protein